MMTEKQTIIPTILCGGAGTRLWPLSRNEYPKQLLSFTGSETMLQSTVKRMNGFDNNRVTLAESPIVICNEGQRFLVAEQLKNIAVEGPSIILEPCGRNTAPALTVAAIHASRNRHDSLLLVMPADHVVEDIMAFHQAINSGIEPALSGAVVTFGVIPDQAETDYGYIQANKCDPIADHVFQLIRFVEKPDRKMAEMYIAAGDYYWNSGMFLLRAETWLQAMNQFQPAMLASCITAFDRGSRDNDFIRLDRKAFFDCRADSIDYAIMEKLTCLSKEVIRGIMVSLDAGWSDIGSWDAIWRIKEKDSHGNSFCGNVLMEDTSQSLVLATFRMVACVGVKEIVVIETPDTVLVGQMEKMQDVKKIVTSLKSMGCREGYDHRKVYRPWGWYDSLEKDKCFQVKRIFVKPGAVLSLQLHSHRSEHWIVVQGTAKVTRGDEEITLNENQSIFIPVGEKHRVANPGQIPLEIIEVQSGSYLGEDDIIRFEDQYGRV